MVLDFYYFSYQCPLNDNMIRLLNEYRDKIDINLYDISNNHLLAGEMKMFFPTLIVLDIVGKKGFSSGYIPFAACSRKDFLSGL